MKAEYFPPGDFIAEEVAERGWKPEYMQKRLGISGAEYASLLTGEMRVDARLAVLLGALFGTSEVFWVNLQMQWSKRK